MLSTYAGDMYNYIYINNKIFTLVHYILYCMYSKKQKIINFYMSLTITSKIYTTSLVKAHSKDIP